MAVMERHGQSRQMRGNGVMWESEQQIETSRGTTLRKLATEPTLADKS